LEGSIAWWAMERKGATPFYFFPLSPNKFYLNFQFFPFTLRSYFTMVLGRYLLIPFLSFDL
jgi:hypothetical protein